MNHVSKALVDAHIGDLHREARRVRIRAVASQAALKSVASPPRAVTLRVGTPGDMPALIRLAALNSSEVPLGPVMLAEVAGELRAAVSLCDRKVIADPFHGPRRSCSCC